MSRQSLLLRDISIASLSGATQAVEGLNGNRQYLQITNTGNANIGVNYSGPATGGTGPGGIGNDATIGSTGTHTVVPNGILLLDAVVPQNPINLKGAAAQKVAIAVA